MKNEIVNDKKFDSTKDKLCPICYFEQDKLVAREVCPGHEN